MKYCGSARRLCRRLILSLSVTFDGTNLIINIPEGSYNNCCRYCIVVAQAIPAETTRNAPVFITIGDGDVLYPLLDCNCAQVTQCGINTRTRYCVEVATSNTAGSFRMVGRNCCSCNDRLDSINGTAPVGAASEGGGDV